MSILKLQASAFRNLSSIELECAPQFNVFYGDNGAGKTSLLESLYYLGLGRSFRSHLANRIIQKDQDQLVLFAELENQAERLSVGVERCRDGSRRIKIDGVLVSSISVLAKSLPIQLMSTFSYRFFHDGPKQRRQFLDWGLFHVKPSFFSLWQQLQQALKQRNAALKRAVGRDQIQFWDGEICQLSEQIDVMRQEYLAGLEPVLFELLEHLLEGQSVSLRYSRGWNKDLPLESVLRSSFQRDCQLGYTQNGPHRADLQLYLGSVPVQDVFSQGQQKLAAYALHLAQGLVLQQAQGRSPIYLVDDLPSELDLSKRRCITDVLTQLKAQVFITGITTDALKDVLQRDEVKLFHVKQGEVVECFT